MKPKDRVLRYLVYANSAAIVVGFVVVLLFAISRRDRIAAAFQNLVDRETVSSKLLTSALGTSSEADTTGLLELKLEIKSKHLRELELQIQEIKKRGHLTDDLKIWHPVIVRCQGQEYKADIRPRGDSYNHWTDAKKSWRIKFDGDALFNGMRVVDLIIPDDKAYEVEHVAGEAARELGVLSQATGFSRLHLNGIDYGAYLWIEQYGDEMLEKQLRPVGAIFREDNIWTLTRNNQLGVKLYGHYPMAYSPANPKAIGLSYYSQRFNEFIDLIRDSSDDEFAKSIPDYLNLEVYLKWNALTWLFGSVHAHWGDNLRWYYNNSTGQFEPILYDVYRYRVAQPSKEDPGILTWRFEYAEYDPLALRLMRIPEIRDRRNRVLWKLLHDAHFDMGTRCNEEFARIRPHLMAGVGGKKAVDLDQFHSSTIEILNENRERLIQKLSFARLFSVGQITDKQHGEFLEVRLMPDCYSQLVVSRLELILAEPTESLDAANDINANVVSPNGDSHSVSLKLSQESDSVVVLSMNQLHLWSPLSEGLQPVPGEWKLMLQLPELKQGRWSQRDFLQRVHVVSTNSLTSKSVTGKMLIEAPAQVRVKRDSRSKSTEGNKNRWAPFELHDTTLRLPAGNYLLDRVYVAPRGMRVQLLPGSVLRMAPGASLLCFGELHALGTDDSPIQIVPAREGQAWGSVAVVRSSTRSRLANVRVEGGSEAYVDGLFLSGQLCFYSSDVELTQCTISGAKADDGLNVKNAEIDIVDCHFVNNSADAFDGDWVHGGVRNCRFIKNGGDAIDLSGSDLCVWDCYIDGCGDKGLSAGEKSRLLVYNCVIQQSLMAVASKDLSKVNMRACVLYGNDVALAGYRKKQIFGGASAQLVGCLLWNNETNVQLDRESQAKLEWCASDHWDEVPNLSSRELMQGDLASAYRPHPNGGYVATSAETSFRIRAPTETVTHSGLAVPDLQGGTVGLQHHLPKPHAPISAAQ